MPEKIDPDVNVFLILADLNNYPEHTAIVLRDGFHTIFQKRKRGKWIVASPGSVQIEPDNLAKAIAACRGYNVIYRPV